MDYEALVALLDANSTRGMPERRAAVLDRVCRANAGGVPIRDLHFGELPRPRPLQFPPSRHPGSPARRGPAPAAPLRQVARARVRARALGPSLLAPSTFSSTSEPSGGGAGGGGGGGGAAGGGGTPRSLRADEESTGRTAADARPHSRAGSRLRAGAGGGGRLGGSALCGARGAATAHLRAALCAAHVDGRV